MEHKTQLWEGLFVEPEKERFEKLVGLYGEKYCWNYPINSKDTIDFILKTFNAPKVFDLLSIDIDGQDFYIWSDMVEYRARVVVIEWSPYVDSHFIPERDYYGKLGTNQAGLFPMLNLARHKDYNVVAITPVNLICVDNEILPLNYWKAGFPVK